MKVAVIGAGWAGLAAAVRLRRLGHEPWVYEAARRIGGRARAVPRPELQATIDCGQHILLGAYRETLDLMAELGVDAGRAFHAQGLRLASADGRFSLGTWPLPAPAHGLGVLLGGRGLGLRERGSLARLLAALGPRKALPAEADSVSRWLDRLGCPARLRRLLWEPLCLAAMNTPADIADARLFLRVLRDSLGANAQAARLLIPRGTLDELWPAQAQARLPRLAIGHRVLSLEAVSGGYRVDGADFEGVILATPPGEAARLLGQLPDAAPWLAAWPQWRFEGIGTVTLRLDRPWGSGQAMRMLEERPERDAHGQWLFDRSAIAHGDAAGLVHVVISGASRIAACDAETVIGGVIGQIREQAPERLPEVRAGTLITEKRATFSATPGQRRPGNRTPWPRLALAGDWTDTGYPAVLEGAVRSGHQAAEALASA
ncbi:hydroxysqualene dehydroxylase HpnE [Castellaniella sp. S9]|uniref:hydroxysqualene dehydroxylase HpnE n=1 Tax=Castellaniella sp. S9 TaxID=2993652 RepID=UPI0022B59E83|nr:hydroxysqualene dehydroxylase HpnE [Castellaniella sp. S9]